MLDNKKILPNKILLKKVETTAKTTQSGLIIPDVAEEVTSMGEVVLVGTQASQLEEPIRVGDRVMYPPRAPQRIKRDDLDYYLLNYTDVLLFWRP